MKKTLVVCLFALVCATFAGAQTPTTITFRSAMTPGYGPDVLPDMNGRYPKGSILTNQYANVGVTFYAFSVAAFAENTECYKAAHDGQDFLGDLGGTFIGVTTLPGTPLGGHLTAIFDHDVTVQNVYVADANASTFPMSRVLVVSYDVAGHPLESRALYGPYAFMTFTKPGVRSLVFYDLGGDGFILGALSFR